MLNLALAITAFEAVSRPASCQLLLRRCASFRASLPPRMSADKSVTGTIYSAGADRPTVQLFTKSGCTLCDVAKEVLAGANATSPHTLEAVDITDAEHAQWWDRYKYDIPVLHVNQAYWAKHRCARPRPRAPSAWRVRGRSSRRRITLEDTLEALAEAEAGSFAARRGQPDAARMERRSSE